MGPRGCRPPRGQRTGTAESVFSASPNTNVFHPEPFVFQVLRFDARRLRDNLTFCDRAPAAVAPRDRFDPFKGAENLMSELWPETLMVCDFTLKGVNIRNTPTFCFPNDLIANIKQKVPRILAAHPSVRRIVLHVGANDIKRCQSEVLKQDFSDLLDALRGSDTQVFVSGPLPQLQRGDERFSRLQALNSWLSTTRFPIHVHFIDNFNLFGKRNDLFRPYGLRLNKTGVQCFKSNLTNCLCSAHQRPE